MNGHSHGIISDFNCFIEIVKIVSCETTRDSFLNLPKFSILYITTCICGSLWDGESGNSFFLTFSFDLRSGNQLMLYQILSLGL